MSSGSRRISSCTGTPRSAVIRFVPRILLDVLHPFRGSAAESKRATRQRRADARRQRAPCPRSSKCAALAFNSRPQRASLPSPTSPSPPPSRSRWPSLNTRPPRLPCSRESRRCHTYMPHRKSKSVVPRRQGAEGLGAAQRRHLPSALAIDRTRTALSTLSARLRQPFDTSGTALYLARTLRCAVHFPTCPGPRVRLLSLRRRRNAFTTRRPRQPRTLCLAQADGVISTPLSPYARRDPTPRPVVLAIHNDHSRSFALP